jgi:HSP20 family molecular chaperone IbpA
MTMISELLQQSLSALGGNLNDSFSGQLSELLQQQGVNMQQLWKPSIDIVETDAVLQIHMNLPGVDSDSIDVDFFNNNVSIKGERHSPALAIVEGAMQRRKEIVYGKFARNIVLPISVTQKDSVSISMNNGVLAIIVDKTIEDRNKFSLKVTPTTQLETTT